MQLQQTRSRASGGVLDDYLREICDDALLTPAEEIALAEAVRNGDKDARSRLIRANLRLVVKIARDFEGRGLALEDLVGEGNLGLIRAAEEFDPSFGTRFSTYASHWIKQAIRHALITTTATIRLPAHMIGLLTRWRRAERNFLRQYGQPPTREQIAMLLGVSDAKRTMVEQALQALRLLPGSGAYEEDRPRLEETADQAESPDMPLVAGDEVQHILQRFNRLDDRERDVLNLRFGLENQGPMTLIEIGRKLGVTREWVRKIEVRALKKLADEEAPTENRSRRRVRARTESSPLQLAQSN